MTQDEIIRMAREAERYANNHCDESEFDDWYMVRDERFANLVAEAATKAERERCKTVLMAAHELSKQHHNYYHYIALQLDETAKVMK